MVLSCFNIQLVGVQFTWLVLAGFYTFCLVDSSFSWSSRTLVDSSFSWSSRTLDCHIACIKIFVNTNDVWKTSEFFSILNQGHIIVLNLFSAMQCFVKLIAALMNNLLGPFLLLYFITYYVWVIVWQCFPYLPLSVTALSQPYLPCYFDSKLYW